MQGHVVKKGKKFSHKCPTNKCQSYDLCPTSNKIRHKEELVKRKLESKATIDPIGQLSILPTETRTEVLQEALRATTLAIAKKREDENKRRNIACFTMPQTTETTQPTTQPTQATQTTQVTKTPTSTTQSIEPQTQSMPQTTNTEKKPLKRDYSEMTKNELEQELDYVKEMIQDFEKRKRNILFNLMDPEQQMELLQKKM
jgi:hypothetical protein